MNRSKTRSGQMMAGFLLALLAGGVSVTAAHAQATGAPAASVWFDGYRRSDNQRALDLAAAEAERRARDGGYGAAIATTNVAGDVVNYSTHNGPENSSTAYNSVNSNQVSANADGSGISLTVHTGQNSGVANQTAIPSSSIGSATTTNTCGGTQSCAGK